MICMEVCQNQLICNPSFSSNDVWLFDSAMRTATWEADPVKQKEIFDKTIQDNVAPYVERIEQHIIKNGTGHLVGQGVSK